MCVQETISLIQAAHEGDRSARDKLVEENVGLVWSIVRRFSSRGYEPEDLFQIGCIGLIKAIDKFDLSYEVRFSTYAVPLVIGEIKRFLRDDGMIKVSRSLKETAMKAREAERLLREQTGEDPGIEEIADAVGVSREELALALEAGATVESLQKTIYQSDGNAILLMDKLVDVSNDNEVMLDKMMLEQLIEELPKQEQELIRLRYYQEYTQTRIAKQLGISQVQVSRMEKRILQALRLKLQES